MKLWHFNSIPQAEINLAPGNHQTQTVQRDPTEQQLCPTPARPASPGWARQRAGGNWWWKPAFR
eukprot:11202923-Lingulodinium_polyedra.AAC.1